MKKILIIITKAEIGGAQEFVLNLARGLSREDCEVTVGFGNGEYLPRELDEYGIRWHRFEQLKRSRNPLSALYCVAELRSFLRQQEFDVVHFNSSNALIGAWGLKRKFPKIRTIFTVHGLSMLAPGYQMNLILKFFYRNYFRFFLSQIDRVVFVCQNNLDEAKTQKIIHTGEVIYNGLETDGLEFHDREFARKNLGEYLAVELENKYVLGSIGRLVYAKNYEFLIERFPRILELNPDAMLVIIGSGPDKAKLEKLIQELRLEKNIFLAGEIKHASKYIRAFDLYVLPSRYEGLSITLIEALTAGVPMLASNVGGNPEIVTEGTGEVFESGSAEDFLEKIGSMQNPPRPGSDRGTPPGRGIVGRFGLDEMVEKYINIYDKIIN